LLFFVWHHVADREAAAQELRRVVKTGGKLFVQANFSDRMLILVVPRHARVEEPRPGAVSIRGRRET
jgi:ubiquinone/menaquinone biosynthesis C-methylase UbiE